MYAHGRGRVVVRAQVAFEETRSGKTAIIVTELPYQVNKAALMEKIAELVKGARIDGIADLRDESDRDGMRMYIELKKDVNPHKVLNNLFKHTAMSSAFNMNMLALVDGQPQTLPLKAVLQHYIDYRREIIRRRTEFDLGKARARAHILEGPQDRPRQPRRGDQDDPRVGRRRRRPDEPHEPVQAVGAPGPGDPRHAAGPAGRARAQEDRGRVPRGHPAHRRARGHPGQPGPGAGRSSRTSSTELKRKYAGERRTRIVDDSSREMTDEDLIADEDVVVTISGRGYIKRQPVATYRRQHRGGKGIIGHVTREEDAVEHLLVATTHDWALFFTNRGRVFSAKVHQIPDASRQAKGMPIINLPGVQVEPGEVPMATITLHDFTAGTYLVLATRRGIIKKTPLEQFEKVRSSGIIAITLDEDDELAWVDTATGRDDIIIATALGKIARFHETEVRPMGRPAGGVIGIRLARKGDSVISMSVVQPDADLLVLTETGYGKRVAADRVPGRSTAAARASSSSPSRAARPATSPRSSRSPRRTRSCS